jgi:hypothetical protein
MKLFFYRYKSINKDAGRKFPDKILIHLAPGFVPLSRESCFVAP